MANQLTSSFKILDKNVGIGTTLPAQKLHVVNSSTGEIARFQTTGDVTGGSWIGFHNSALDLGYFGWGSTSNNDLYVINYQNAPIRFYTNGTEKMRIAANGNVGINATSLSNKLTVDGNTLLDGNLTVTGQSLLLSASYVNITSSVVSIGDNILTLNAYSPFKRYAGFEMHDSGSSALAQFLWDSENNYFFVSGSTETNSQHQILLGPDGKADLTAGALPVSYTGNELSSSVVYQKGENVGIGITSPADPLDVLGKVSINTDGTINWGAAKDYGRLTWDTGKAIVRGESGKALSLGANGTQDYVFIDTSGNVGIGTPSPSYKTDIYSTNSIGLRIHRPSNTSLYGNPIGIGFSTRNDASTSTTDTRSGIFSLYNGELFLATNTVAIDSDPTGSARLYVDNTGQVGIGTTTPGTLFHVYQSSASSLETLFENSGSGQVGLTLRTDRSSDGNLIGFINFDANDSSNTNTRYATIESYIVDSSNATEDGRLTFSTFVDGTDVEVMHIMGYVDEGRVGIGTIQPARKLHVAGGDINIDTGYNYLWGSGDAAIRSNGYNMMFETYTGAALTEKVRIQGDGNVGIGTTSPTAQLEISSSSASSLLHVKGAGGNNILYVSGSGNIGIGTTSPTSRLYVNGGSKYLGGGDWTTIERVTSTEGNYALYVQTTGTNTNQAIAKFNYGATEGTANSGTAVAAIARQTSTFISQLHIYGSTSVAGSVYGAFLGTYSGGTNISPGELVLATQAKTGWGPGDELGRIRFYLGDPSGVGTRDVAKIVAVNEDGNGSNTTTASGALAFYTSVYNKASLERVRIDQSGKVGIGVTSPTARFQINDNYTIDATYGGDDIYIKSNNNRSSYDPVVYNTSSIDSLITVSSNTTTGPDQVGLVLYNDDNTAGGFSPMLLFSKRETGSSPYKATMAGIYARSPLGTGNSNAWIDGELIFATAGASSEGIKQRMVINKEGLVGIGTISPSYNLHISSSSTAAIGITGTGGSKDTWTITSSDNSGYGVLNFRDEDSSTTALTLRQDGNVGIGTTNPDSAKFEIHQNSSSTFKIFGQSTLEVFGVGATGQTTITGQTANTVFSITNSGAGDFMDVGGGSLYVSGSGNVGIGTSSPSYKLHVVGNSYIDATSANPTLLLGRYTGQQSILAGSDDGGYLIMDSSGAGTGRAALNWYSSDHVVLAGGGGNVGIGTTGPTAQLEISSSSASSLLNVKGAGGNGLLYVSGSGHVGMGTTSPSSRLNVISDISSESVFKAEGTSGTLFEVTDDLSNSLMSVNTIAGLPVFEVFSDYHIVGGRYNQNDFYLDTNGNLGLGTASPSAKLDVRGSAVIGRTYDIGSYSTADFDLIITNGGSDSSIMLYDDVGTAYHSALVNYGNGILSLGLNNANGANSILTTTAVNVTSTGVGIGTTSPNVKLEIHGSDITTSADTTAESVLRLVRDIVDPNATLRKDSAVDFMLSRQQAVANNLPYTRLDIRLAGITDSSTPSVDVMSLLYDGNVGIGTTSPSAKLNIAGDVLVDTGYSLFTDAVDEARYNETTGDGGIAVNAFNFNGSNGGPNIQIANNYSRGWANIYTNKIDAGADVTNANNRHLSMYTDGARAWDFNINSTDDLAIVNVQTGNLLLDPTEAGKVGIGTTDPAVQLNVYGTDAEFRIQRAGGSFTGILYQGFPSGLPFIAGDNELAFGGAGTWTEHMRITSGGNVGIGTTSPTEKLEVSGSILSNSFGVSGSAVTPSFIGVPQGGSYNSNSTETGYLKINLPIEPTMTTDVTVSFKVKVSSGSSNKFSIYNVTGTLSGQSIWQAASGYFETPWQTTFNATSGSFISFGRDGTNTTGKSSVLINSGRNELSSWFSPIVQVYDVSIGGVNEYNVSDWLEGWNVSFTTSTLGHTSVTYPMGRISGTNPTPLKYNQSISGTVILAIQGQWGGFQRISLASGTTIQSISYTNIPAGYSVTIAVLLLYGGTATVTWTNVKWSGGVTPTLTGVNGKADLFTITTYDGGSNWIGSVVAQNLDSTNL